MFKDYPNLITEELCELTPLRRKLTSTRLKVRLEMLIGLKSKTHRSLEALSVHLGYHCNSLKNWFKLYETGGLSHLLQLKYWKRPSVLDKQPLLEQHLKTEGFDTIKAAQIWLEKELEIGLGYEAIRAWFAKQKVKLKTGRPCHILQDKEALMAFKKTLVEK